MSGRAQARGVRLEGVWQYSSASCQHKPMHQQHLQRMRPDAGTNPAALTCHERQIEAGIRTDSLVFATAGCSTPILLQHRSQRAVHGLKPGAPRDKRGCCTRGCRERSPSPTDCGLQLLHSGVGPCPPGCSLYCQTAAQQANNEASVSQCPGRCLLMQARPNPCHMPHV